MANPVHHARSSARHFGGAWEEHWPVHAFFDQTKAAEPTGRHRVILHSTFGVDLAVWRFGTALVLADQRRLSITAMSERHIREDFGRRFPTPSELFVFAPGTGEQGIMFERIANTARPLRQLAHRFLVDPEAPELVRLVDWFALPARYLPDDRAGFLLGHAFGPFLAEQTFGPVIDAGLPTPTPTRILVEALVKRIRQGHIPSLSDLIHRLPVPEWVLSSARPVGEEPL